MIDTPVTSYSEDIVGDRFITPSFGEQIGWLHPADLGIGVPDYVWVYPPEGMSVYGPGDGLNPISPAELFVDALRCSRGDHDPRAIAAAFDSKHFLKVLVSV